MSTRMPALSLAALPGRRAQMIEIAKEAESRGFSGIYGPSLGDAMSLMLAIALNTEHIRLGTTVMPIYGATAFNFAQTAAFLHEMSNGRFHFGTGISHGPVYERLNVSVGKPLSDMRRFVEELRAVPRTGDLPPLVLAAMRKRMIGLAGEIAEGMVFANGARSHMADSLAVLPAEKRDGDDFFIGCMTPTCISDDVEAAKAVNRRTLTGYAQLPNYRNYWKEAGFEEEMADVEKAIADNAPERIPAALSDRWLAEVTLFGPAGHVREQVEAWFDAGIKTPILVPSSAAGNQLVAIREVFDTFAD